MRKLAIARLAESELAFFSFHSQKKEQEPCSLKLNSDVFARQLYPYLQSHPETKKGWFLSNLSIYGPGIKSGCAFVRKLVKSIEDQNWWLNGNFFDYDNPARFALLQSGDLVIFEYFGALYPSEITIFCVAQSLPEDTLIHKELCCLLGGGKMARVTPEQLAEAISTANLSESHPINELTLESALVDAAQGGIWGQQKLGRRRSGNKLSKEQLQRARDKADDIGQKGEEWISIYLTRLQAEGNIADFEWASAENAISPYDFRLSLNTGEKVSLDAKATQGSFDSRIHISLSELYEMRDATNRYDLYRIFNMGESSAQLCIAENTRAFATNILTALESMPSGVTADSVSVALSSVPNGLVFGTPILIELPDDLSEE